MEDPMMYIPTAKRMKFNTDERNNDDVKPQFIRKTVINAGLESEKSNTLEIYDPPAKKKKYDSGAAESNASTSQYTHVTHDVLQKLKEFKILDEVNDDDIKEEDSDISGKSDELPDEEIEKMLEEDLPEDFKRVPKTKEKPYITREKIVLQEKGINHFEMLPLDWIMVRHCSGLPVYMHRSSRVCTLSKPYFLGKGNTRTHDIPISAIPCLAYRTALEEEEKQSDIDRSIAEQIRNGTCDNVKQETKEPEQSHTKYLNLIELKELENNSQIPSGDCKPTLESPLKSEIVSSNANDNAKDSLIEPKIEAFQNRDKAKCEFYKDIHGRKPVVLPGGIVMPPPRVETVNTSWKTQHLPADKVNEYCKNLFQFKTVNVKHFKRWADRRTCPKVRKTLQYPTLPEGTKLISIPAQNIESGGKATKPDWVMNMNGSSCLSVFHEYVRKSLQKQPVYEFKQLENAATPYQATVYIGGMQYGVGNGSSKRQAKSAAARASIHILIPEMKDELDQHTQQTAPDNGEPDSFFDHVGIEDPRIQEICAVTTEPSPHAILRTCLLRNFGVGDKHIHTEMKKLEYQKIELTMKVGKHSATVACKNKKQAKERAAQSILQQLHPQIRSWGSLLRLYGSRSVKKCKEKKLEEQQITLLQDKAQKNKPNYAVLEKLRIEMKKLKERDEAVVPIGSLQVCADLPTHSGSMLNNVDM